MLWKYFFTLWTSEGLRDPWSGVQGSTLKSIGMAEKAHIRKTWDLTCDLWKLFPFSWPLLPPSGLNYGQNLFQLWHSQLSALSELVFNILIEQIFSSFSFLLILILLEQTLTELECKKGVYDIQRWKVRWSPGLVYKNIDSLWQWGWLSTENRCLAPE